MLKFQSTLAALLGSVLLVPALASQGPSQGLERSLAETVRALEVLAGIQRGIEARHPAAVALAKQATEPAGGEARERDQRMVTLRDEVNRLQAMSDRLQGTETQAEEVDLVLASPVEPAGGEAPRVIVSTGLSAAARAELSGFALPGSRPAHAESTPERTSPAAAANEALADPLRQAQVLYRAGRYEECAAMLRKHESSLEAAWWRARALERGGRELEALECYRKAAASPDTLLAARARRDLEFLEWKQSFESKLAAPAAAGKPAPAAPAAKEKP